MKEKEREKLLSELRKNAQIQSEINEKLMQLIDELISSSTKEIEHDPIDAYKKIQTNFYSNLNNLFYKEYADRLDKEKFDYYCKNQKEIFEKSIVVKITEEEACNANYAFVLIDSEVRKIYDESCINSNKNGLNTNKKITKFFEDGIKNLKKHKWYIGVMLCFGELPKQREKGVLYILKTDHGFIKVYPFYNIEEFHTLDQYHWNEFCSMQNNRVPKFPEKKGDQPIKIKSSKSADLVEGISELCGYPKNQYKAENSKCIIEKMTEITFKYSHFFCALMITDNEFKEENSVLIFHKKHLDVFRDNYLKPLEKDGDYKEYVVCMRKYLQLTQELYLCIEKHQSDPDKFKIIEASIDEYDNFLINSSSNFSKQFNASVKISDFFIVIMQKTIAPLIQSIIRNNNENLIDVKSETVKRLLNLNNTVKTLFPPELPPQPKKAENKHSKIPRNDEKEGIHTNDNLFHKSNDSFDMVVSSNQKPSLIAIEQISFELFLGYYNDNLKENTLYLYVENENGIDQLGYKVKGFEEKFHLNIEDVEPACRERLVTAINKKELNTMTGEDKSQLFLIASKRGHIKPMPPHLYEFLTWGKNKTREMVELFHAEKSDMKQVLDQALNELKKQYYQLSRLCHSDKNIDKVDFDNENFHQLTNMKQYHFIAFHFATLNGKDINTYPEWAISEIIQEYEAGGSTVDFSKVKKWEDFFAVVDAFEQSLKKEEAFNKWFEKKSKELDDKLAELKKDFADIRKTITETLPNEFRQELAKQREEFMAELDRKVEERNKKVLLHPLNTSIMSIENTATLPTQANSFDVNHSFLNQ